MLSRQAPLDSWLLFFSVFEVDFRIVVEFRVASMLQYNADEFHTESKCAGRLTQLRAGAYLL